MPTKPPANDHDLLIQVDQKLDDMSVLLMEVRSTLAEKADAVRVEKLETSVESLKSKAQWAAGVIAALQLGLHWLARAGSRAV